MTYYMFINNQRTALAAAASATATTLTLASSTGLPGSLPSGAVMPFYLLDAATQTIREIVYCTAISGTTLTVTRAQEGTGAQNWSVGDYIYCDLTAATTGASQINPPAQFDNSNAVASTSWVKAAGLMLAEQIALAASTTLTASQAGNAIYAYGNTTPITITLPLAASAAIGDMVFPIINASNYAVTVATQGSDTSTIPNLVVGPGQSLIVMNNGTASWSQLVGSNGSTLAPLTVGNAVSAGQAVALGQSLAGASVTNQTANRALGTTYTNSTPRSIFVLVGSLIGSNGNLITYINGNLVANAGNGATASEQVQTFFIVPPSSTYEVVNGTLEQWYEIR